MTRTQHHTTARRPVIGVTLDAEPPAAAP